MQDLIIHEQFEIEVLERLNSNKFLNNLVFGGGTMLRLCYELDRYSADLDFWVVNDIDFKKLFTELKSNLSQYYKIVDSADKFYTILYELKSPHYPRSLKIEIRKELKNIKVDTGIAYSKHSNVQVMVNHVSLTDMMNAKIQAFLNRKEIRDIYDMEFLFKRGTPLEADIETLNSLIKGIEGLTKNDYSVKLSSLLEADKRKYYKDNNFKILSMYLKGKLAG